MAKIIFCVLFCFGDIHIFFQTMFWRHFDTAFKGRRFLKFLVYVAMAHSHNISLFCIIALSCFDPVANDCLLLFTMCSFSISRLVEIFVSIF